MGADWARPREGGRRGSAPCLGWEPIIWMLYSPGDMLDMRGGGGCAGGAFGG